MSFAFVRLSPHLLRPALRNLWLLRGCNTKVSKLFQRTSCRPFMKSTSPCYLLLSSGPAQTAASCNVQQQRCEQTSSSSAREKGAQGAVQKALKFLNDASGLIWKEMKPIKCTPFPILFIGLSGLIPFVAIPCCMMYSQFFSTSLAYAQTAYGASVLSFLGGVRWGYIIPDASSQQPDWQTLGLGLAPILVGWAGLLMSYPCSLLTVMGGIAAAAYFDRNHKNYPRWFKGMHFTLSIGALFSMCATLLCGFILPQPVLEEEGEEDEYS